MANLILKGSKATLQNHGFAGANKKVLNPQDYQYHDTHYYISIGHYRSVEMVVHADNLLEALDQVINWMEEQDNNDGWWLDAEDLESEADILDEYLMGGNHGRYTSFGNDELIAIEFRK